MFISKEDAKFFKEYAMQYAEVYITMLQNLKECTNYIYDSENDKSSDRESGFNFGIKFCRKYISQYLNIAETFKDEVDVDISKQCADVMLNFIRENSREDLKLFETEKSEDEIKDSENFFNIAYGGKNDIQGEDQTLEEYKKELEKIISILTFGSKKVA